VFVTTASRKKYYCSAECADEVSLSKIEAVSLDSLRADEREDGGSTASTYSQATPHPPQS